MDTNMHSEKYFLRLQMEVKICQPKPLEIFKSVPRIYRNIPEKFSTKLKNLYLATCILVEKAVWWNYSLFICVFLYHWMAKETLEIEIFWAGLYLYSTSAIQCFYMIFNFMLLLSSWNKHKNKLWKVLRFA